MRFAALDVTTNEPYPFDGVLRKLKNVLLFPHIAGYAHSEVHCLSDCVLMQFDNFLDGKEIENTVTLDMLKIMA
jgi:lactate dehydrogenase-like 2-hydroxyacid dehydrogenase